LKGEFLYAELTLKTHYSFLRGASSPDEIVEQAIALGYSAIGICDVGGVYGLPKVYDAIRKKKASIKLIAGAELPLEGGGRIFFLAKNRIGYGVLCRFLTLCHQKVDLKKDKITWASFFEMAPFELGENCLFLSEDVSEDKLCQLLDTFPRDQFFLLISRHFDGADVFKIEEVRRQAGQLGVRILVHNDVHFHLPERKRLQDALTCIRNGKKIDDAQEALFSNFERHLKSPDKMLSLFKDIPEAIENTQWIVDRCDFSLKELRYQYPSEWIPQGESAQSFLIKEVRKAALVRYPKGVPQSVASQIQHELALIDQLNFADYFLTLWDIVNFAKKSGILCQGRGSAANSVVCYCLGITAVDPLRLNLLFERFISAERGEPPDIDVDFEHERREEVIQYIYRKYGRDRAAMVSAVVTFQERSVKRELDQIFEGYEEVKENLKNELLGFPRHLSIHSGGFTLSALPIIEAVPVEPARMSGRTIIQWDKKDLEIVGLLKVDILALGMLTAIQKTLSLLPNLDFYGIPEGDVRTYQMIQKADTVGVFQIESRAQMSMLPRIKPENYYDLVIQVAIVRPGPIVGKMVHPYLKRRRGQDKVELADPRLKKILGRTLGVPLFQEQVMRLAIELAGFSAGEADELRRAIAAWGAEGSVEKMAQRLMQGLLKSGLSKEYAQLIFEQIHGFSEYGFPESHAASFALIVYVSAYLKCHHPAEFSCALLNSQPLGFYSNQTLIEDAKRHGVKVYPLNPQESEWDCTIVQEEKGRAIRLGWRILKGVSRDSVDKLISEKKKRPFESLWDFLQRCGLRRDLKERLAEGDGFRCFGISQRQALWEILRWEFVSLSQSDTQFELFPESEKTLTFVFPQAKPLQELKMDYRSFGLSARGHPMLFLRRHLNRKELRITTQTIKATAPSGRHLKVGGLVIVRQRPHTAQGNGFATLEDETGFLDLIFKKKTLERYLHQFYGSSFLFVSGKLQRDGDAVSLLVTKAEDLFQKFSKTPFTNREQ
jgi:error-prone DNA polymerase